jgi:HEAT repeat protein
LLEALRDQDPEVRKEAARALAAVGGDADEVVPGVLATLDQTDGEFRAELVELLGLLSLRGQHERILPALLRAAKDPVARVREEAAEALKRRASGAPCRP